MIKQEEIREGIKQLALRVVCPNTMKPATPYEIGAVKNYEAFGVAVLFYLHSQGVVIKVDRGLPQHLKMMWCHSSKDMPFEEFALEDSFRKAGYVAVEPLVKE